MIQSLAEIRPPNWALSEQYQMYVKNPETEGATTWQPELTYYIALIRRIADSMYSTLILYTPAKMMSEFNFNFSLAISGKNIFYLSDWRFNEFPNASAHALYVTCVELLSLPVSPTDVANNIIDVIIKGYTVIAPSELHGWINVLGLLMTALPEAYWSVIYDRLQQTIEANKMIRWKYRCSPFDMFNFKTVKEAMLEKSYVLLLAIAQSILHHSSIGQIATLST